MSHAEILAELPKLSCEERDEVHRRLLELDEHDLMNGLEPTEAKRQLLDEEWAAFEKDGDLGMPWREFMQSLRKPGPR